MDELLELIARIGKDNSPTGDELSAARKELAELLKVATAKETRDLEAAVKLREAIDSIDGEVKARATREANDEAEVRRLLEGIDPKEVEEDEQVTPEKEPEPVSASTGLSAAIRVANAARARMKTEEPAGHKNARIYTLNSAQTEILRPDATIDDIASVFNSASSRVKGRQALVRIEYDAPEDRRLVSAQPGDNTRLLNAVTSPSAVVAAGGICGPLPADFANPYFGVRGRPIRDALPRFQGTRGGVRFAPAATLANMSGSVGVWTHATDTSPSDTEKACLTVDCEAESTAYVDAVTACLQVGNFQAIFNPEFWRSRLELLMVAHDRLAEQTLAATIDAASVQVTYGAGNGTIHSVLAAADKGAAGLRSRLRLSGVPLVMIAPSWVKSALRTDIASQRLGSSPAEALAASDTVIDNFYAVRGITPVWSEDLDLFSAQTTGALQDYPGGNTEFYLFPAGTFFFLDGGTLDLGTEIYDSELISQNNRMAFMETFEKAVFRGGQSLAITVPIDEVCVCPDVAVIETS